MKWHWGMLCPTRALRIALFCCCFAITAAEVSQAGMILASLVNGTVRKYDSVTGADLGIFASGFSSPSAIGYEPARANNGFVGSVYIADYNANLVRKYTTGGVFLGNFGSGYNGPEGIVVDSAGNVYVSNYGSSETRKFNSGGGLITAFNVGGNPEEIRIASNGDLLVNVYSGPNGGKVRRFTSAGTFVSDFATGLSNNLPLVVDSSGNAYVGEFGGSQRVMKYSPAGGLSIDSAALGFNIYGLAFNELGELLVARFNTTSTIYRYDQNLNLLNTFATTTSNFTHIGYIPEPSSALLLALALLGATRYRRQ